jgi:hypothetical protein
MPALGLFLELVNRNRFPLSVFEEHLQGRWIISLGFLTPRMGTLIGRDFRVLDSDWPECW